ncbi:hypothetical protein WJX81_001869 [Elliptochloris bilobata]|uniref:WDR5-like beta-propeller domain-containing protein n=1 Tax=Elliptochloris bilobata TaxID=381761 RepID=A0AAW1SIV7_9CHLO
MAQPGEVANATPPAAAQTHEEARPAGGETRRIPADPHRPAYQLKRTLEGHTRGVVSVKFSNDGRRLASASADKTARVWDPFTGDCLHILSGHTEGVNDVAWDPEDRYLATASDDKTLLLWAAQTGERLRKLEGHTNYVFCCAFNPAHGSLVSGSFDETVRLWEVKEGKEIKHLPAHSDPVTAVDFNRDGTLIVSSSYDGLARLWYPATGSCRATLVDAAAPPVAFAKFSPNGKYVLVATLDDTLKLWDYEKVKAVKVYRGHKNRMHCLFGAFCVTDTKGKWIVAGSEDHSIFIWGLNTKQVVQVLPGRPSKDAPGEGHCDAVLAVACHPKETMIASGALGADCTVKVWVDEALAPS